MRRKGLIRQIPRSQRYELTRRGPPDRRLLHEDLHKDPQPALAELDPQLPDDIARRSALPRSWRDFERALEDQIEQGAIAA
jgi:hypothetical protein